MKAIVLSIYAVVVVIIFEYLFKVTVTKLMVMIPVLVIGMLLLNKIITSNGQS
ncbi:hypothetical protein J2S06_002355 [Bacillus alveayuensis]|uniref:Uncharacterized protein n=1 Tax=Aeribacillus alveayuensis TaxID=279215 RepID=A0ABT9VQN1_9BACI|nr:hypothetical protein [Bacillus alveayuensis]